MPDRKENINLLKNIALKNWTAVANAILTHSELRQDILRALWRTLNSEVKNYCSSDSVLKHRTPKELIAFSNCSLVKEVSTDCPFWSSCISGACGVNIKENCDSSANNAIALATSVTARFRNKSMSALAYRISSILFHSGVSHQGLTRLNRLGLCMSPKMIVGLQRSSHHPPFLFVLVNRVREMHSTSSPDQVSQSAFPVHFLDAEIQIYET